MKRVLKLIFLTMGLCSCVTSMEDDINLNATAHEDDDYAESLNKWTKSRTVIKNFETRYRITATYLSPDFRSSFARRFKEIYLNEDMKLAEADKKAGFFVSLYIPNEDSDDLSNNNHWTVVLKTANGDLRPQIIKKVRDKTRWNPFFSGIDEWSSEFLVVFDTPSMDPKSPDLVASSDLSLVVANADAQVLLEW